MTYPPPPGQSPYPAAPPPPPPGSGKLRGGTPRKLGWIFLALAVALFVVGGVIVAKKSLSDINGFQRVAVSTGSGTVKINATGKWVGYYEASNVDNDISRIPQVRLLITDPAGNDVTFKPFGNRSDGKVDKFTYDYNGHKGAAAVQFDAKTKGSYKIQVQAVDQLPSGADIAFGRDITTGTVVGALLIVGGVLFLVAAIVLLIVGYVKRSRAKKERERYAQGGGYGPPPGGYKPPPGGYGPPPQQGYGQGYGGQTA